VIFSNVANILTTFGTNARLRVEALNGAQLLVNNKTYP